MIKEVIKIQRVITMIEIYVGINEEMHQIKVGAESDLSIPLSIRQQILFMDEEIGLWEDGGIDYSQIDKFDEWVVDNYEEILEKICPCTKKMRFDAHVLIHPARAPNQRTNR